MVDVLEPGKLKCHPVAAPPQRDAQVAGLPEQERQSGWPLWRAKLLACTPYLLTLAIAVVLFAKAGQIEFDHVPGRIGPDVWPKLILALLMAASLWGTAKTLLFDIGGEASPMLHRIENAGDADAAGSDEREIYPARVWAALAGTLVYLWIMQYLGFFLSTFAFLVFIIYVGGYRRISRLLPISLIGSLLFMTIFVRVIYVSLPLGVEPFSRISLALLALLNI
jgi:putative tricarboxylic transport membrane protein